MPSENPFKNIPTEQKVEKSDADQEKEFLYSLDISPRQRHELRFFINDLKDFNQYLRFSTDDRDREKLLTPDIFKTKYIQELVKKKFRNTLQSEKNPNHVTGDWAKIIEKFGIEESFFLGKEFDFYRRDRWLETIGDGEHPDFPGTGYFSTREKDQIELKLKYGEFKNTGIGQEVDSREVKEAALDGLAHIVFKGFGDHYEESEKEKVITKYKESFKISEKEFEDVIIQRIENIINDKYSSASSLKEGNDMRKEYPFIDKYLNSPRAKELAQKRLLYNLIHDINWSNGNEEIIELFSISQNDLNQEEIQKGQRAEALKNLNEKVIKQDDNLSYEIESASKHLLPEDWQKIFQDPEILKKLIQGFAQGFQFSFKIDENLQIYKNIGATDEMIKKAAIFAIANEFNQRDTSGNAQSMIQKFVEELKISESEIKEGITLGLLNKLEHSSNKHEIQHIIENFNITDMADSPEIQERAKEVFLHCVENVNRENLKFIKENFKIKWEIEERPIRSQALKSALVDEYRLRRDFNSMEQIKDFVRDFYPDRHKVFFLADPEIKTAAEKRLKGLVWDEGYYFDYNFVKEFSSYFNISKEKVINEIRQKIENGDFASDPKEINSIKRCFPEIDLKVENELCLQNHGEEIIETDLENCNWNELREIKKSENKDIQLKIQEILKTQEDNLKNPEQSPEIRAYAIEALTNLSEGNEFLENNYLKELVDIYTKVDKKKLLDLFKRKSEAVNNLEEGARTLVFDKLLETNKENSHEHQEFYLEILQRDSINYLNKEQVNKLFLFKQYTHSVVGIRDILNKGHAISQDVIDTLYNNLTGDKKKDLNNLDKDNFSKNIISLVNLTLEDEKLLKLLEKQEILKELAINPDSVSRLKKIMSEIPTQLLVQNWAYLYPSFKDLPDSEFERYKLLLQRIEPHLNSKFFSGQPLEKIFKIILSYKPEEQNKLFKILEMKSQVSIKEFDEENWAEAIMTYVNDAEDDNWLNKDSNRKESIISLFSEGSKYRDVALDSLQKEWKTFLQNGENKHLPPSLFLISKMIDETGGAGNLKHVESLGNFIFQINKTLENSNTPNRTKNEIRKLLVSQENRFEKEKLSQDGRSEFYNISKDVLEAAPSLYSAFAPIFEQMSPKDVKIFTKDIFPLYQAQLIIIQSMNNNDEVQYNPRDLVVVRQSLKDILDKITKNPENKITIFNDEKSRLLDIVKDGFKNRFGLIKVPEEFDKESLRSIQNTIRYIGNINRRDLEKEAILAFFLGLKLNNEWGKFRQGEIIKAEDYLSGKQLDIIRPILEEKLKSYESITENTGISIEQMKRFQEILQEDVISNMMGNVQTIDLKLGNIKRNVEELTDPDIYNTQRDKETIKLLMEHKKLVGSTLAKIFGESSGKKIEMNEEEKELQKKIADIFNITKWDISEVKKIQDAIQPFSLITNMINKMEEEKVDENIEELQKRLVPSQKIIEIFNRLGENFEQESGAVALFKDLTYLESLIIKDEGKLTSEEKEEVKKYIDSIKEKMQELESTLDKIREYFNKIKKSSHFENQELLKERILDIEKIIYSQSTNEMIISHMTKDLNLIIENMRQCLGCMRKEANNDTNLAFGDYNKFFMYNQSEKERGSISDEIIFFVPKKEPDGSREMSFVMDQVYGSKSSDVLISNILSIYKKHQAIKKEFPEAKISITVSRAAMSSVGLSAESLEQRLRKVLKDAKSIEDVKDMIAEIPKSVLSDNYVEFAGGARATGERDFSGLVIR